MTAKPAPKDSTIFAIFGAGTTQINQHTGLDEFIWDEDMAAGILARHDARITREARIEELKNYLGQEAVLDLNVLEIKFLKERITYLKRKMKKKK